MTNPSCQSCGGWGFKNQIVGSRPDLTPVYDPPHMIMCDDVYPSHDGIPPHLRGQPCTPRTMHVRHAPIRTNRMIDNGRMMGGMRLASEKAAATRAINQAKKAAEASKEHKPSRSNRR